MGESSHILIHCFVVFIESCTQSDNVSGASFHLELSRYGSSGLLYSHAIRAMSISREGSVGGEEIG